MGDISDHVGQFEFDIGVNYEPKFEGELLRTIAEAAELGFRAQRLVQSYLRGEDGHLRLMPNDKERHVPAAIAFNDSKYVLFCPEQDIEWQPLNLPRLAISEGMSIGDTVDICKYFIETQTQREVDGETETKPQPISFPPAKRKGTRFYTLHHRSETLPKVVKAAETQGYYPKQILQIHRSLGHGYLALAKRKLVFSSPLARITSEDYKEGIVYCLYLPEKSSE